MGQHRPGARQAARAGGRVDRRGAVAAAVDAAHAAVLAAGGTVRGQGARHETAAVLGLEPGAGRRQRRPELRGGTADDGRPARLLRPPRRAAAAAAQADADSGRRPVPSPASPAAAAVPAAGGPGASARRAARAGSPGVGALPGRCAACGPEAAEPAGGEHRRSVGMGRAAPAGSGPARLPAGVARRRAGRGVGQRAVPAAQSGRLRRLRRRSARGRPAIARPASSGTRGAAHGPRPRLAGDSRGKESARRERRR